MRLLSTRKLRRRWTNFVRKHVFGSYSQYGEDLLLDAILGIERPFYIDIGANHPTHLSNTFRFFRRGATGINIEPDPDAHRALARMRPTDINLQVGISDVAGELPFYRMSASTLSTFSRADAELYLKDGYRILDTVAVPVRSLLSVLEEHRPHGAIDFMSVDVEGLELQILRSNDWGRFRPMVVVLEINRNESALTAFMNSIDYLLVVNNGTNGIFIDRSARRECSPAGGGDRTGSVRDLDSP